VDQVPTDIVISEIAFERSERQQFLIQPEPDLRAREVVATGFVAILHFSQPFQGPHMPTIPKVIPALFPPLFGAVALAFLWQAHGVPLIGWLAMIIWSGVALTYVGRVLAAPAILKRDLDTLPGRTGLTAANLTLMLVAAFMAPRSGLAATGLLALSLLIQIALILTFLSRIRGDKNLRAVQPVWQMIFTGFVVAIPAAALTGALPLAQVLLGYSVAAAAAIWALTGLQFALKRFPPPQLRPALAIHLSPAAMVGQGALFSGYPALADTFFWVSAAIFVALVVNIRWITAHGFSPFWSAFTFPLVGFAGLSFIIHAALGWILTALATAVVAYVCARIFALWRSGRLAELTFAAL
jgi:tellurite resistance protein